MKAVSKKSIFWAVLLAGSLFMLTYEIAFDFSYNETISEYIEISGK